MLIRAEMAEAPWLWVSVFTSGGWNAGGRLAGALMGVVTDWLSAAEARG